MRFRLPNINRWRRKQRRRRDAIDDAISSIDTGADRLGDLPDCLLHVILASLGSRLAMQTSVLSRRWRHLWRDVPCVDIDEREFADGGDHCWERFEDFADRTLTTIPPEMRLDAFRLHLVSRRGNASAERWVRRGLRHLPTAVEIHAVRDGISYVVWKPHLPATGLCAAGFTRRLTTLRLVEVIIIDDFLEYLGRHCPVLEELHLERCDTHMYAVASPTLRRLVIAGPGCYVRGNPLVKFTAPRLASMRLEINYIGEEYAAVPKPNLEPLPLLTQASIRLTDTWPYGSRMLNFLKSMPGLLALLPNVVNLHLSGFPTMSLLNEESQGFPVLHNLRNLVLEECDVGEKFQALTVVLQNTPNLEKLGLHQCTFLAPVAPTRQKMKAPAKRRRLASRVSWCENLKSIEMKSRQEDKAHLTKVLSKISKGMTRAQWQQVQTSSTIV